MRAISSAELTRLTDTAESSLNDTCDIHVPTITMTALATQEKSYTTTSNVACGFDVLGKSDALKNYRGQVTTLDAEALLRLPLDQEYEHKYEVTVRGLRYKTESIKIGKTAKLIGLKRVDVHEQ
jgi:hypothetical protein